jgi:SEC-C motif-containing protein
LAKKTPQTEAAACPCCSGRTYDDCFRPAHDGSRPAATAEALMRSRFSAHVLRLPGYLLASWHPETRPAEAALADGCKWLRLEILARSDGGPQDSQGTVTFVAWFTQGGRAQALREHSRFARHEGRWVYRDAVLPDEPNGSHCSPDGLA